MLDFIAPEYRLLVGLGGLTGLMLFAASAAQKYQAHQAEKRAAISRMMWQTDELEDALNQVTNAGVPGEILQAVWHELLARYMAVHQIHRNYPGINARIGNAQQKAQAAEGMGQRAAGRVEDLLQLNKLVAALTVLRHFLAGDGRLTGLSPARGKQYADTLGNLRARLLWQTHGDIARRAAQDGDWKEANTHAQAVRVYLESHGPATEEVHALHKEVRRACELIGQQNWPEAERQDQPAA